MSVPPQRPQSPITTTVPLGPPADPIDVDLVVRSIPHGELLVDKPFRVACTLGVAVSVREGQQRTLSLAVQHVQPPSAAPEVVVAPLLTTMTTTSHLPPPAGANPRPSSPAPRTPLALLDGQFIGSPRTAQLAAGAEAEESTLRLLSVPPPEPMVGDEGRYGKLRGAMHFLGPSTLLVPPMTFARTIPDSGDDDKKDESNSGATKKEEQFWEFELAYAPLKIGFVLVGGLRVLLLEDRVDGGAEAYPDKRTPSVPVTLREWDVIGEIWVKS
jgi:hypothetical protein